MNFIPLCSSKTCDARINILSLPPVLRDFAEAVAKSTCTANELVVPAIIGAMSAVTQGTFYVEVTPNYIEQLSLYINLVAGSGERKSAVLSAVTKPIEEYQKLHPERVVFSTNATSEAIVKIMAENNGKLSIITDEGSGIIDVIMGRYGKGPNLDIWLDGYSGTLYRSDRVTRNSDFVPEAHLASLLAMQPGVAEQLIANETARERGLIARMLFALPMSTVGHRSFLTPAMPTEITNRYSKLLTSYLNINTDHPIKLNFTVDAMTRLDNIFNLIEKGMYLKQYASEEWAKKLFGNIIRLAGIYHLAGGVDRLTCQIETTTVDAAMEMADYFLQTEEYMMSEHRVAIDYKNAEYVFLNLVKGGGEMSQSELARRCRGKCSTFDETNRLIEILEDHGYVTRREQQQTGVGRPKTPIVTATQIATEYEKNAINTQN